MDHSITLATGPQGNDIDFSPVFNVAVPFIDRHLREGRAQRPAIRTYDGETVDYAQLAERVNRCGNALLAAGLERGQRVLMIVRDCPAFFYLFWGAIKAGIIPVPVNTLLRHGDYAYMIDDAEPAGLVFSAVHAAEVAAALAEAEHRPGLVLQIEAGAGAAPGDSDLAAHMARADAALEPAPSGPEDDCFWLYSSGSTGRPKGAVHAHRDMVVSSQRYGVEVLGVSEDDVCFSAAKLFFAYGLGNAMSFPLWVGACAVLLAPKPTPQLSFEVIERHRPTLFFGVPTLYAAQLKALAAAEKAPALDSLRLCTSAGEALSPELLRRWKERTGLDILDGIGSTEALHIFLSNREGDIRPGASGTPVPGYEVRIVDEHGQAVAAGESGSLEIRGDSIARYYWKQPERTAETMGSGWLKTGDTYLRDADGYYVYCGRSDDMFKVGGIWCSPFEIEARLVEHPQVQEAAVVKRADAQGLDKPEAWIVLDAPERLGDAEALAQLEAELVAHCKQALARYKFPRWFRFVDSLPKTATGKIQRFKLRAAPGADKAADTAE
ncbi:benzoate-CoA ligase family protein [Haliangium ochraceum]|uniref:Benzoate-CoA ligase family n=1 Tax=Haliangium ochraceum (strain DSM 14365 / JCM 11303 / SMP-2) TaxID=502025 RepID=D0LRL1_HALO1|nr:benzoate-CoA ligase family protein [Haliangium ochraceum]ACY19003.1 benzoate-CoA ligase family [Haliangium ochraceum DSM 14365]